jgi:hypothetical protein
LGKGKGEQRAHKSVVELALGRVEALGSRWAPAMAAASVPRKALRLGKAMVWKLEVGTAPPRDGSWVKLRGLESEGSSEAGKAVLMGGPTAAETGSKSALGLGVLSGPAGL